jgi:hypothetical protein
MQKNFYHTKNTSRWEPENRMLYENVIYTDEARTAGEINHQCLVLSDL